MASNFILCSLYASVSPHHQEGLNLFFPWLEHIFRRGPNMTFMISKLPSSCSISVLGKRIEVKRRIYWELCTFFINFFVLLTYNNSFNWNSNSHLLLCFICIFFPLFLSGRCVIDREFFFLNFYSIGMKNVFCLILIWKI